MIITKQNKETNLALRDATISRSSSKSERNPNEEVIPNTATTIAKPNLQGAAHNIIQKGAFTQSHTSKSKIIAKARKPNHVFRNRAGLSAHINPFISQFWAHFIDFTRKRPSLVRDRFVVQQRVVAYERVDCIMKT